MPESQDDPSVLLIVDDESSVCRALSRIFEKRADEVIAALGPMEAETVFASKNVTHLVCDHLFGIGQPLGVDLAQKWLERFPTLRHVVVLTGTDVSTLTPPDSRILIMEKTVNPDDLIEALQLELHLS